MHEEPEARGEVAREEDEVDGVGGGREGGFGKFHGRRSLDSNVLYH